MCLAVTFEIYHNKFIDYFIVHKVFIYNVRNTNFSIIVFPSEFQQKDGGITCKNISSNLIKKFDFPNEFLLDETEALETCQKFCLRNLTCWGCSLICQDGSTICYSGKWIAISECDRPERLGVHERTLTSQKLSKNSMACIFFFLC